MATRSAPDFENDPAIKVTRGSYIEAICDFDLGERSEVEEVEIRSFLTALYTNTPLDELRDYPIERLRAMGLSFWNFAEQREGGADMSRPKVRVFNPDSEIDGWDGHHTVIEILSDDMPFLVASMIAEINDRDLQIKFLAHPIVTVLRDESGRRLFDHADLMSDVEGERVGRESMIHFEVSRISEEAALDDLRISLIEILRHTVLAVMDWKPMDQRINETLDHLKACSADIPQEEIDEAVAFLQWLSNDHFLFFGARDYQFKGDPQIGELVPTEGTSLGVLKDPDVVILRRTYEVRDLTPLVRDSLLQPSPIIVTKSNTRSLVHRRAYMDYIGVKLYTKDGALCGERRFVGLFTSGVYNRSTRDIPFVRRKAQLVIEKTGYLPSSHDANALFNVIENFPRDELFQIDVDELAETCNGILRLTERPHTRAFVRRDPFDRFVSVLVYIPRERFTSALRKRIGTFLAEAFSGRQSIFYTQMGDSPLARVHYIIGRNTGAPAGPSDTVIEAEIAECVRSWQDKFEDVLHQRYGSREADRLFQLYSGAFNEAYKEAFDADEAADDVATFESLESGPISARCYRLPTDPEHALRLKLYRENVEITLTSCMPILENMGLNVVSEFGYKIKPGKCVQKPGRKLVWVHDFYMEQLDNGVVNIVALRDVLRNAILAIWNGDAEDDGFNRLIVSPGIAWRDVAILRACAKYRLQLGSAFSQAYMEEALAENAAIALQLIYFFKVLHDPRVSEDMEVRLEKAEEIRSNIVKALQGVESLDQDRIIRRILNLMETITRTNYFQPDSNGNIKSYLSFKVDARRVEGMPDPRPFAEIFVYSPRVEGVHLRGGPVARGGLRWSDRREDFRTEVLGLVKAQQVKNAVIVPSGAKGGFFPKQLPSQGTREEIQGEAIEAYKIFISGLLDLTDNLPLGAGDGKAINPQGVVCYDPEDPYLVVAADKGTASFSDIANGVSKDYGFWLGDAFASGGSVGYDHKAMGITARGAWEAVKRHFRELGKDIQREPFSVIGVGDMSGDVFGNGMLLSRHIRLAAAFDHRHIFVDPHPNAASTWEERHRLFDLPRSSWDDFDRDKISQGGGVFRRSAKSIDVSDEMRAVFGLTQSQVTPVELINAILRVPADLLWFGGIGTYVKSSLESDHDVGDRANDTIRLNARELQVKVVGEGANLGCTQRARIEFAQKGGRINMDAVDNAAGVDCSDHEVNIKILIDSALAAGHLKSEDRTPLLEEMTDAVGAHVLQNDYDQTLALSIAEATSQHDRDSDGRLMRALERQSRLDRALEFLPSDEKLIEMAETNSGLTRPELAVLMSYTKTSIDDALLASDVPDDPYFEPMLKSYFPEVLQNRFESCILQHRLRRQIISTELANEVVDVAGITFAHRMSEITGASISDVAKAFYATMDLYRIRDLRQRINDLDNVVASEVQHEMHLEVHHLLRTQVQWLLSHGRLGELESTIGRYKSGIDAVFDAPRSVVVGLEVSAIDERIKHFSDSGVDLDLAGRVAILKPMSFAGDIVDLAHRSGLTVDHVASAYFLIGAELRLDRVRAAASTLFSGEHYDRLAIKRMTSDLSYYQRTVAGAALVTREESTGNERVMSWLKEHDEKVSRFRQLYGELEEAGGLNIAKLSLLNSQMHDLVQIIRNT